MNVSKNYLFLVCLFVVSLPLSGCNQENKKLQAENSDLRVKLYLLETELTKQPRNLDRKDAEEILNRYLSTPSVKRIKFMASGFELAKTNGVISKNSGKEWPEYPWILSEKGKMIFGSIVNGEIIESIIITQIEGNYVFRPEIAEKVVSIKGISDGPYRGTKVVQVITTYVLPSDVNEQEIAKYIYMAERKDAILRRYDDGWRVEEIKRY